MVKKLFSVAGIDLWFVLILEVPLAAETKKKKPTIPDIPNIAAKGSKVKENIEFIKSR